MKKLIALFCVAATMFCVSGCGCTSDKKETETPSVSTEEIAPTNETETQENPQQEEPQQENVPETESAKEPTNLPQISENKTVVSEQNAPEVYIVLEPGNDVALTYHLENCPELKGKESQKVSWEMVKTVGFWQCPTCNPPRYEDYKNAE